MNKITNVNVKKEHNILIRNLIIGILLVVISIVLLFVSSSSETSENDNIPDLDSIIVSEEEDYSKEDRKAYIDIASVPYKFAGYDDRTEAYYIVSDGTYLYIAYMSDADYLGLNNESIYTEGTKRIEGITALTTKEVKELAIDAYNTSAESEEDMITIADFDNYFGSVYLDMTKVNTSNTTFPLAMFFIFGTAGIIIIIASIIRLRKFSNSIKKLNSDKIEEINKEMEDENAFYYKKAHLYLTDKYIINFGKGFDVIEYKDIMWMYPFEQRVNGIRSAISIMVLTNDGKTHRVAQLELLTKQKKEMYNEIWDTILSKNPNMLTGFTKENIGIMKDKVKDIKLEKKRNK